MDQLFDRLSTLLKSLFAGGTSQNESVFGGKDNFFDEAWEELDAFLKQDREKEDFYRRRNEEQNREQTGYAGTTHREVDDALKVLGLTRSADFAEVKMAYKRLLKEHHPDRFASDPIAQKKATEVCAIYNQAYAILEKHYQP